MAKTEANVQLLVDAEGVVHGSVTHEDGWIGVAAETPELAALLEQALAAHGIDALDPSEVEELAAPDLDVGGDLDAECTEQQHTTCDLKTAIGFASTVAEEEGLSALTPTLQRIQEQKRLSGTAEARQALAELVAAAAGASQDVRDEVAGIARFAFPGGLESQ